MRQAILSFRDETVADWGFEPFQDAGLLDAEMLYCEGTRGVIRIHVEEELDEDSLDELAVVRWWERVSSERSETVYLVEFEGTDGDGGTGVDVDALPPSEDMELTDHGFDLTYVGPQARIRDVVTEFESAGNEVTLRALGGYRIDDGPLDALTDRQLEVLETAREKGYYDVPRTSSMREIAAELGLDDSTVAEHLQRAERNLVTAVLGNSG